jgi:cytochrome P450
MSQLFFDASILTSPSATLTWTLIELCKQPHIQTRLRAELLAFFPHSDPDFDDFTQGLPFLDAVVHETLRLHPPLVEAWRHVSRTDTEEATSTK